MTRRATERQGADAIATLPNLGPRLAEMLTAAGIATVSQLRALGAVEAWCRVREAVGSGASLNLLWALEGALSGRNWKQVARSDRLNLLLQVEARALAVRR